ncbi:hypothetical protein U0070_001274 [Myodes glareolus]|uniref:Lactase-like protein n=1 Tax=Myodes glareolus TaxID=447135 RepID=A0AAW0I4C9_MYOGA
MKPESGIILGWILLVARVGAARRGSPEEASFYYGTFPPGMSIPPLLCFSWGVGSSAYQTEGAWDQDGKGPSIWDAFTHSGEGRVLGDETADAACDSYYRVQEDIALVKELRVSHYRLSLSWPRILPTGIRAEQVNRRGIEFYSDFIDALLKSNLTPIVTLHHWDLPQMLQVTYGGWQNVSMTRYFRDYADLCFEVFGDRVKHWLTFSDPRTMVEKGYETGLHAPGLRLPGTGLYVAAHHIIKAHAQAWHSYNNTWRSKQQGMVGISLNCDWGEPVDINNPSDIEAAERYLQFCLGWFANPIYAGTKSTEQGLEMSRLPTFSLQEKSYIRGTSDFLGLGHFTTRYIIQRKYPSHQGPSFQNDRDLIELVDPNWPDMGSSWLYSVPWGFRRLLNFAQCIKCIKNAIIYVFTAIKDGVNIKGYTSWSLLDKFEWEKGYADRYGFYYVEFNVRNKPRYPKASVQYYKEIITANGFPNSQEVESWRLKALETCSINNQMLATEPLLRHMHVASEIVVPTVCALSILIAALLLTFLLRSHS